MPYTGALQAANRANAGFYATNRKYSPNYGELAKVGMNEASKEKRAAMQSETSVRMAGMRAVSNVSTATNKLKAGLKKQEIHNNARMAGVVAGAASKVAGVGAYAAAGGFDKPTRTKPSEGMDYSARITELRERSARLRGEADDVLNGTNTKPDKGSTTETPTTDTPTKPTTDTSTKSTPKPAAVTWEGGAFKPIEYLSGDPNHKSSYRADHGGSNYHEHLAFGSTKERDAAMAKLREHGIKIGSINDGKHSEHSYHYSDQAFVVPGTNWAVGEEAAGSKRVREILGLE